MYTKLSDCPTSVLRSETIKHNITKDCLLTMSRDDCIQFLKERGVFVLETKTHNVQVSAATEPIYTLPCENYQLDSFRHIPTRAMEITDLLVSNYVQEGVNISNKYNLYERRSTDARYSNLTVTKDLRVGEKLYINNLDISAEIQNVMTEHDTLANDVTDVDMRLIHLRNTIETSQNENILLINPSSDIEFILNDIEPAAYLNVIEASGFGQLTDSTVALQIKIIVGFDNLMDSSETNNDDKTVYEDKEIRVRLPYQADTSIVQRYTGPIIFGFSYDSEIENITSSRPNLSSVAYIDYNDPTVLRIRNPSLFTLKTTVEVNINIRYFMKPEAGIPSPSRFSSLMFEQNAQTVRTDYNVISSHKYTVLGKRIELVGNSVAQINDIIGTLGSIAIELPMIADDLKGLDVIGHVIIKNSASNNVWFTAPILLIDDSNTRQMTLYWSGEGFKASASYDIVYHVVYQRSMTDRIINLHFERNFVNPGETAYLKWTTTNAVNRYYFLNNVIDIKTPWTNTIIFSQLLQGTKTSWKVPIDVPMDTAAGSITAEIAFFGETYTAPICIIDRIAPDQIQTSEFEVTTSGITFDITKFTDDSVIKHEIVIRALRRSGLILDSVDAIDVIRNVSKDFVSDSSPISVRLENLLDDTEYEIEITFTDELMKTAVFNPFPINPTTSSLNKPTVYTYLISNIFNVPKAVYKSINALVEQNMNDNNIVLENDDDDNEFSFSFTATGYVNSITDVEIYSFITTEQKTPEQQFEIIYPETNFSIEQSLELKSLYGNYYVSTAEIDDIHPPFRYVQDEVYDTIGLSNDGSVDADGFSLTLVTFTNIEPTETMILIQSTSISNKDYLISENLIVQQTLNNISPFIDITFPSKVIGFSNLTDIEDSFYLNIVSFKTIDGTYDGIQEIRQINDVSLELQTEGYIGRDLSIKSLNFTINLIFDLNVDDVYLAQMTQINEGVEVNIEMIVTKEKDSRFNFVVDRGQTIIPGQLLFKVISLYGVYELPITYDEVSSTLHFDVIIENENFYSVVANIVSFVPEVNSRYYFNVHAYDISTDVAQIQRQTLTVSDSVYPLKIEMDRTTATFEEISTESFLSVDSFNEYQRYEIGNLKHSTKYMFQFEFEDAYNQTTTMFPLFVSTPSIPQIAQIQVTQNGYKMMINANIDTLFGENVTWYYCMVSDFQAISNFTSLVLPSNESFQVDIEQFSDDVQFYDHTYFHTRVYFTFESSYGLLETPISLLSGGVRGILYNQVVSKTKYANHTTDIHFEYIQLGEMTNTTYALKVTSLETFETQTHTLAQLEYSSVVDNDTVSVQVITSEISAILESGYIQLVIHYNIGDESLSTSSYEYATLADLVSPSEDVDVFVQIRDDTVYLHVENFIDDTPIEKFVSVRSLANLDYEIINTKLVFEYPTRPTDVDTLESINRYTIEWITDLTNNTSINFVPFEQMLKAILYVGDVVTFTQTDRPLKQGYVSDGVFIEGTNVSGFVNDMIEYVVPSSGLFFHGGVGFNLYIDGIPRPEEVHDSTHSSLGSTGGNMEVYFLARLDGRTDDGGITNMERLFFQDINGNSVSFVMDYINRTYMNTSQAAKSNTELQQRLAQSDDKIAWFPPEGDTNFYNRDLIRITVGKQATRVSIRFSDVNPSRMQGLTVYSPTNEFSPNYLNANQTNNFWVAGNFTPIYLATSNSPFYTPLTPFTCDITDFDLDFDIFQITITDALNQQTVVYHPHTWMGRIKTSSVSTNVDTVTGMVSFMFQVENFVCIPNFEGNTNNYTVFHELYSGTTLLETYNPQGSVYTNGSTESIILNTLHEYGEYTIESKIMKGSNTIIHSVGSLFVDLINSNNYDTLYMEEQAFATNNLLVSTVEDGIYFVGLISLETNFMPTNALQLVSQETASVYGTELNIVYTLKADDMVVEEYGILKTSAFKALNDANGIVVSSATEAIDINLSTKATLTKHSQVSGNVFKSYFAIVLVRLTGINPVELKFRHQLSQVTFRAPLFGSNVVNMDELERLRQMSTPPTSFVKLSFLSNIETNLHTILTNSNGTLMNQMEANTLFTAYLDNENNIRELYSLYPLS